MARQRELTVADQRDVAPQLRWLTLHAPELVREVRAGQYLLVRCTDPGGYDPLLRRALFVAAAEPALGQIALLYEPADAGLRWLARCRAGDAIDVIGPLGRPFAIEGRTRALLLIGSGDGLPALLLLARQSLARGGSVTLLAGAASPDRLPPAFLLPDDVEYQTIVGRATDLLPAPGAEPQPGSVEIRRKLAARRGSPAPDQLSLDSPIAWADQVCAALPADEIPALAAAVSRAKVRSERGFASVLLGGALFCGVGACGLCSVQLRRGSRLLCSDGPVFDLRELAAHAV